MHARTPRFALRSLSVVLFSSSAWAWFVPVAGENADAEEQLGSLEGMVSPHFALQGEGDPWSWRVAPYLWMTDIDGNVSTQNLDVDFEVDFSDIWDNLGGAGLLLVEASKGQFGVVSDLVYLALDLDGETPTGMDADADVDTLIWDLVGLYRLTPTSPFQVGLGLRYADLENDLDAGVVSADVERDAFDGVVAGRATVPFAERWYGSLYGDVGAGDSDLTWQATALLGLRFHGWALAGGYRAIGYDFEEGSDELDFTIHGLVFGAEFLF